VSVRATSTWELDTEPVHDGFFHPEGVAPPLTVDSSRFHHITIAALPQSVMFCRIRVRGPESEPRVHLIVYADHPRLEDDLVTRLGDVLAAAFPAEVIAFTRDVETGRALVATHDGKLEADIAAAVATVLATAAWDESDPIVVSSGERRFDVSLTFRDGWRARVATADPFIADPKP
jgi:hypothetical protein